MALASVYETATQKYFDKKLTTQIAFSSPEFFKIFENSNTRGSGRSYVWEPLYARRAVTYYPRYGGVTRVPTETFTQAELPNVRCIASAMLDEGDVSENTGKEQIIELLATSLAGLKDDTVYGMAGKIWTGTGGLEPVGLYSAISTAASTTYAGISRTTYDWFDNTRVNASAAEVSQSLMEQAYLGACHDTSKPDFAVTDKVIYRKLFAVAVALQHIMVPLTPTGKSLAALGFEVMEFNGVPVVWSDNAPVGNALVGTDSTGSRGIVWFLNTKDIEMRFIPGRKMKRTEWRNLEAQPDVISCDMKNHYCLAVKTPRNHAVLYGLKEN